MKRLLLLFFYSLSSVCMQSPDLPNQFIAAIKEANFEKVKTMLDAQPSLQKSIREYYNFTSEPILKFAVRNPELKPRYMEIARYLINRGARVHPSALEQLEAHEKSQRPPERKTATSSMPAQSNPAQARVSGVKPMLTPVSKPAAPAKPSSKTATKAPAVYKELYALVLPPQFDQTKNYVESHDTTSLTKKEREDIMASVVSTLGSLGPTTPETLHDLRRIFSLLQKNGFEIPSYLATIFQRTQRGDFGPRSGQVESLLNLAIKNKDLARVKHLVENEDADVNTTDSSRRAPLLLAAIVDAPEIARYLFSKGARLYENDYENRQFRPILETWGIRVP